MKLIFLAIQKDRHAVQVIVLAFINNIHIHQITVYCTPHAPENIGKHAVLPVHINVIVPSKVQKNILFLIKISQLAVNALQHIHRIHGKLHYAVAVIIDVNRIIGIFSRFQGSNLWYLIISHFFHILLSRFTETAAKRIAVKIFKGFAGTNFRINIEIRQVSIIGIIT